MRWELPLSCSCEVFHFLLVFLRRGCDSHVGDEGNHPYGVALEHDDAVGNSDHHFGNGAHRYSRLTLVVFLFFLNVAQVGGALVQQVVKALS